MAAACWVLASFILGTFNPREMSANDSTASEEVSSDSRFKLSYLQTPAIICVSMPNWFEKPPAKYEIPPLPLPVTYGTFRIWLNMWPLVNMRTAIKLITAHRFRFWMTGKMYGYATVPNVNNPVVMVTAVMSLLQLNGRCSSGYSPAGRCRFIQPWMASADCGPRKSNRSGFGSADAFGPVVGGKRKRTGAVWSWYWICQCVSRSWSQQLTDMKTFLPWSKSSVPKSILAFFFLSPFCQLFATTSHSGANSLQIPQAYLASRAVRTTAAW